MSRLFALVLDGNRPLLLPMPQPVREPVTLKLAFFASDTEVNYAKAIKFWVEAVNADPSGNAVKIEAYPERRAWQGAAGAAAARCSTALLTSPSSIRRWCRAASRTTRCSSCRASSAT